MATRHALNQVYGVQRDLPLNYVLRGGVDTPLIESLTKDRHVVIYGSSKQGKTCLRKFNLQEEDYMVVTCSSKWDLAKLHTAILKEAGYTTEQSRTLTQSGANKINAKLTGKVKTPLAEVGGELGAGMGEVESISIIDKDLELDPEDVNDIIRGLEEIGFRQYVVLEDFHYLPEETQRDFAIALKAFHENSDLCFIIVGVWLDRNRLIYHNGDLAQRLEMVDADDWTVAELERVVEKGGQLLNVTFDPSVVTTAIRNSFHSVSIVQEIFHVVCGECGIYRTLDQAIKGVGKGTHTLGLAKKIVSKDGNHRYKSFIRKFAEGHKPTRLEIFRYLTQVVLESDTGELQAGLRKAEIARRVTATHPEGILLNQGHITTALHSIQHLQASKPGTRPIVLDYDRTTERLGVVDRSFLIWLEHQDREQLFAEVFPSALRL